MLSLNSQCTKNVSGPHQGLWVKMKNQKMFVGCFSLGKGWGIAQQSTNISSLCIKKPEGMHVLNWGVGGGGESFVDDTLLWVVAG